MGLFADCVCAAEFYYVGHAYCCPGFIGPRLPTCPKSHNILDLATFVCGVCVRER